MAYRLDRAPDPGKFLVCQAAEADLSEIRLVPTVTVPHIGPFADRRAQGASVVTGGPVGEVVRQVEKSSGAVPGIGQILLEPKELGGLHLRRYGSADVTQHIVFRGIDSLRLRHRPMIHPYDHVSLIVRLRAQRYRTVAIVEGDQRAGGVESHPTHFVRGDPCLRRRLTHRPTAGKPYVVGRLFGEIRFRSPHPDRMARGTQHHAVRRENSGSGAAGADIDAYVTVRQRLTATEHANLEAKLVTQRDHLAEYIPVCDGDVITEIVRHQGIA